MFGHHHILAGRPAPSLARSENGMIGTFRRWRLPVGSHREPELQMRQQHMMTRRALLTASAAALAFCATFLAPCRTRAGGETARVLVGFPAGGTTDVIARLLAGAMKGDMSAMIVENRSGGADASPSRP
jgi:hypothetical protein